MILPFEILSIIINQKKHISQEIYLEVWRGRQIFEGRTFISLPNFQSPLPIVDSSSCKGETKSNEHLSWTPWEWNFLNVHDQLIICCLPADEAFCCCSTLQVVTSQLNLSPFFALNGSAVSYLLFSLTLCPSLSGACLVGAGSKVASWLGEPELSALAGPPFVGFAAADPGTMQGRVSDSIHVGEALKLSTGALAVTVNYSQFSKRIVDVKFKLKM